MIDIDTNVIIIGEQITGLYAGIRALEKGYSVTIIEKKHKQCTISEDRVILSDNHFAFKKLLLKNNITLTLIDNKTTDLLNIVLEKCDKIPIPIQKTIFFEDLCCTFLTNSEFILLKTKFKDYFKLKTMRVFNAIILIKKNYLNKEHFIINEGISYLLYKLRSKFLGQGGRIFYTTTVKSIDVDTLTDTFITYTKNKTFRSNIVVCTLNLNNILKIYKWNKTQIEIFNNIIAIPKKTLNETKSIKINEKILNMFNIAIPHKIISNKKHYLWRDLVNVLKYYNKIKTIMGDNIHFYVCNECFSKNQGWLSGSIDMVNDVMTNF